MMNRYEALNMAHLNKGHIFTTDELWADDENCILVDSLGNLVFGDGEPVTCEETLPLDGWYDATDIDDSESVENISWMHTTHPRIGSYYDSVLYDEEDA